MSLITYQIEVTICLSVFYIVYYLFLRYETFFNFNRYILIIAIVSSFVIPLIEIPSISVVSSVIEPIQIENQINEITIYAQQNIEKTSNQINPVNYINYAGIFLSLVLMLIGLVKIFKIFRKSNSININGNKIYLTDEDVNPFTFFNMIFINKNLIEDNKIHSIINHELVHKSQKHSYDILVIEILKAFQWFNPVIYLLTKEIREVHEYIADSSVIKNEEKSNYIDILLNMTIGAQVSDLANNFNGIKLIKRLKMISRPKSEKSAAIKYLMILPALIVLFLAFSCKEDIGQANTNSGDYKDIYPNVKKSNGDIKEYSEERSGIKMQIVDEYAKCIINSNHYDFHIKILSKMKLHEELSKKKDAMKVMVSFKVDKNGKISMPIITNYKYADAKNWSKKRLPKNIEEDILNSFLEAEILCIPAIKDGKSIDSYSGLMLLIGDEESWYNSNVGGLVYRGDSNMTFMRGVDVPYSESESGQKRGKALIKNQHLNFILSNLKYPESAKKNKIEGTVIIEFRVDANGNVIDAKVEDGIGYGCDEEALRVVKELKNFEPNKTFNGESVLKLPIKFKLKY